MLQKINSKTMQQIYSSTEEDFYFIFVLYAIQSDVNTLKI